MPARSITFKTPEQRAQTLSFCATSPKHVQAWVNGLPRMNVGECARQLYRAVQEVNELSIKAGPRFEMLEALREPIHYVCSCLSKHYLGRAVTLQPKETKIATLSQALQNHLSVGYKAVLNQLQNSKFGSNKALLAETIHRTLIEQSFVLLRSFQLYYPAPDNFWRDVHQLWLLAHGQKALHYTYSDTLSKHKISINDAYMALLLLATAQTNKLRQSAIQDAYDMAFRCTSLCTLSLNKQDDDLFAVNLQTDLPPNYEALIAPGKPDTILHFNPKNLSDAIRGYLESPEQNPPQGLTIPDTMEKESLRVLVQAWGVLTQRSFARIQESGKLHLAVGLSSVHYYLSDKMDFDNTVRHLNASSAVGVAYDGPFEHTKKEERIDRHDSWGVSINPDAAAVAEKSGGISQQIAEHAQAYEGESDKYLEYNCDIINTSPSGYCLSWHQDIPPQVKTGEIVSVQNTPNGIRSVGIIRWVKQFKNEGARIGVELVAPKCQAVGVQPVHKLGDTCEFMRALILPELKAIGQPASLITPRVSFQVGNKINLYHEQRIVRAQLLGLISSTASIFQFQYKLLESQLPDSNVEPSADEPSDEFDSIWSSL